MSRSARLENALQALTEADDFLARGAAPATPDELAVIVRSHRAKVLNEAGFAQLDAAGARETYRKFACDQLGDVVVGLPFGSVALHGLGKVHAAVASQQLAGIVDPRGKAEVYLRAALVADSANYPAANDLAVLLAEEGRLDDARLLLLQAVRVAPHPAMWNNLAAVHDRLGQRSLAVAARHESHQLSLGRATTGQPVMPTHDVHWVDPRRFAAASRPSVDESSRSFRPTGAAGAAASSRAAVPQASPVDAAPLLEARRPTRNSILN
jgi:hypothetical protein